VNNNGSQANNASGSLHDSDIITKATGDIRVEHTGSGLKLPAIEDRYKTQKGIPGQVSVSSSTEMVTPNNTGL